MTPASLVEALRARGVQLVTDGRRIGITPAQSVTPEERAALRRHKGEILALLGAPPELPRLDPETVREVLGERPDPNVVVGVSWHVLDTLRALEAEIVSGCIAPGRRLVYGRPLGDWLNLDDIARLLRVRRERGTR